jgi:hypothetical protein
MQFRLRFLLLAAAALVACGTDHPTAPGDQTPPSVRLKDVVLSSLPSPFYHFEYDATGRIIALSYASELATYDVIYTGNRITEIRRRALSNPDRLQYVYDDSGRVTTVKYVNDSGVFKVVFLTYDGPRLATLERDRRVTGGYLVDRTMTMYYDGAGNLRDLITEVRPIDGVQTASTTADQFTDYDDGINVDGFDVIHDDFFDQLILLPGVQLQQSNPRHVTHLATGTSFVVDYAYTYDDQKRPVSRTGNVTITSGDQTGLAVVISALFSYY